MYFGVSNDLKLELFGILKWQYSDLKLFVLLSKYYPSTLTVGCGLIHYVFRLSVLAYFFTRCFAKESRKISVTYQKHYI